MKAAAVFPAGAAAQRRNNLLAPVACGCALIGLTGYVVAVDPSDGGVFLPCPYRAATGLWCPGCGLTRAVHHLFRGELAAALRFNAFVVVVVVALATAWAAWFSTSRGRRWRWRPAVSPAATLVGAVILVVVFAVVRNLPGVDGLRG